MIRLILIILLFLQCNLFISEEQRVVNIINIGKKAVEQEDLSNLLTIISGDYQDDRGHNFERLMDWFRAYFNRYNNIRLQIAKNKVVVSNNNAVCDLYVVISGNDIYTQDYFGTKMHLFVFLRKFTNKWLVTFASASQSIF